LTRLASNADKLPEPSADWCYFLDVDGTLTEIAGSPDAIEISDRVLDVLGNLSITTGGALALISGRPLNELDRLFSPLMLPAVGQHGMEIRGPDGAVFHPSPMPPGYQIILAQLRGYAEGIPGVVLEEKGFSLALHYRQAPGEAGNAKVAATTALTGFHDSFQLLHGKMVLEIRPKAIDKGTAVHSLMEIGPYAGRRPVFAGDDTTDEDGFGAVNELNGLSIRVGRDSETCAQYRIDGVSHLLQWLARIN